MLLVSINGRRWLVPREQFDVFFRLCDKHGNKEYQILEYIPIVHLEPKEHKK